jgi:hypothetical protein
VGSASLDFDKTGERQRPFDRLAFSQHCVLVVCSKHTRIVGGKLRNSKQNIVAMAFLG